jgi:hypothetical protein
MPIPSTEQLVLSVKTFLETDVIPKLEHRAAFHARVAANVLAIVAREMQQAPDTVARDALTSLLKRPSDHPAQEVCADIRNGTLSVETDGVVDTLLRVAMTRVAVDNPKYSSYMRLLGQ